MEVRASNPANINVFVLYLVWGRHLHCKVNAQKEIRRLISSAPIYFRVNSLHYSAVSLILMITYADCF